METNHKQPELNEERDAEAVKLLAYIAINLAQYRELQKSAIIGYILTENLTNEQDKLSSVAYKGSKGVKPKLVQEEVVSVQGFSVGSMVSLAGEKIIGRIKAVGVDKDGKDYLVNWWKEGLKWVSKDELIYLN